MPDDPQKVCFIVMGFGKKTDYESGRTLDMDATYDAIIRPAVEAAGLRCVRADDIVHSGLIDTPMYEMLLRADLVIADISTGNINAVYELGVRHALRPYATIIMREQGGKLSFDLNHIITLQYEHLGPDIGSREALRARQQLLGLITGVMANPKADSPVYGFLPKLIQPTLSEAKFEALVSAVETLQGTLAGHLSAGEQAMRASDFSSAASEFTIAAQMKPGEPKIIQQLALATYKSQRPTPEDALLNGLEILGALAPERSNDPETLGIAGAMHKRFWLCKHDRPHLDAAIRYYGRGFELMRDYYNGENLATCYDMRADVQEDAAEKTYDAMSARKVRRSVLDLLTALMALPTFAERSDRKWIHATMSNCFYSLGQFDEGLAQEQAFLNEIPADWEIQSFNGGKQAALSRAAR